MISIPKSIGAYSGSLGPIRSRFSGLWQRKLPLNIDLLEVRTWTDGKIDEITRRIRLSPKDSTSHTLVKVPANEVDKLFAQEPFSYIEPGGGGASIRDRYEQLSGM